MPKPTPSVDVVVPVHGGWALVERCLASLETQTVDVNIFVVDDASPDDVADRVAVEYPDVTLIRNIENLGFAKSCNVGIRAGHGEVVVLLNSDVSATDNMAETLYSQFVDRGGSRIGSATPLLLQPDGLVDAFGIAADPTLAGFVRFHGAAVTAANPESPKIIGPYGALAAYRREALHEVGLLDENIFMYGEELELAFRLAAGGWSTAATNEALGTHLGGASTGLGSPRQRYLGGFGRGYTVRVYDVLRSRWAPRLVLTEAIVAIVGMLQHKDAAHIKGRLDGWRAGRHVTKRITPALHLDKEITLMRSLLMRSQTYWSRASGG